MTLTSLSISDVSALEILDSRGNPTLQVTLTDSGGRPAVAGALRRLDRESGGGGAARRRARTVCR